MKRHLGWIRVAATAAILAGGPHAVAQYAPFWQTQQQPVTPGPMTPAATTPAATTPAVGQREQVVAQRPPVATQQQAIAPQYGQPVAPQQQVIAPTASAAQPTYMPYQPKAPQQTVAQQQPATTQPSATTPYSTSAATTYPQVASAYPQAASAYPPTAGYPRVASAYPQVATGYPRVASADPQTATTYAPYSPTGYPQTADRYAPYYSAVAQESDDPLPAPEQTLPPPSASVVETNGVETNGATNGEPANGTTNGAANGHDMPGGYPATNGAAMPMHNGQNGYPSTTSSGAACDEGGYPDYGLSGYFDNPSYDAQWFGGVYFLWMERDNSSPVKLTARVDHATATDPYYPVGTTTVLASPDFDYRAGVEVRLGSTFSVGGTCDDGTSCSTGHGYGYNGYGSNSCNTCPPACPDIFAWEVAWWGIDDDSDQVRYLDATPTLADPIRIYGMVNFAGLEYDFDADGTYDSTVNTFYGYGLPIPAPPGAPAPDGYVIVLGQRVRQNFDAQNLELNFIRFPVCEAACGPCASGCDAGGCGEYGYGAGACGCEPACCPPAFSMYGSCGVRYFRADEEFQYANEYGYYTGGVIDQAAFDGFTYDSPNELFYNIDVENHLVGAQLGWSMNYCVACKWNFFANSTFGVFNNHINHYQRMYSGGGGPVRFAQNGETFRVRSDKDDLAFLGELRLGGSYDFTCNWRGVAAYRAVAVTGVATSTDQIPSDFTNREYVAIIDSDNSLIVHGLQVGVECRY